MKTVIVVGGGAAGMIAAAVAAQNQNRVVLYEKNEKLGKKLFITGKGRCNVTNACDVEELFTNIVTNAKFLYSAFYSFTNFDLMKFLEDLGCPLKTERGGRVFPQSDKSSDVIAAFSRHLHKLGVEICLRQPVERLFIENGRCRGVYLKGAGQKQPVEADAVILATGGLSYPSTGSTGDGYQMAGQAGLQVTDLSPALVPFETRETVVKELQGLSLKNIRISVSQQGKLLYQDFGEMLFTHFGVSGPVILSGSSFVVKALQKGPLTLSIDLKPALSREQLDGRLLREFEACKNKQLKNALVHVYPTRLLPVMMDRMGISPEKKIHEITREEREKMIEATKAFTLTLTKTRDYPEAIITQGGISVRELNPSTMEAKKLPGFYVAGEVLDLDGVTGGFNLQIAWSTGYLAGNSIC